MEAEGDPARQMDPGERLAGEVLSGEHDQVGSPALGIVDVGERVAVVLGARVLRRDPSRTATPGTMPSPSIQWWASGSSRPRTFGPLRGRDAGSAGRVVAAAGPPAPQTTPAAAVRAAPRSTVRRV